MQLKRWQKLMKAFGLSNHNQCHQDLVNAYAEKHRYYHTSEHINACLKHLDRTIDLAENSKQIELALWFHDAIYQPYSKDNELNSALWAERFLGDAGINERVIKNVYELIMVTLHRPEAKLVGDQALMVDIDLTILATEPQIYAAFEQNVRKEYRWVPYFLYKKKRKHILQGFLKQDSIYHHQYYINAFEKKARDNIQHAIKHL